MSDTADFCPDQDELRQATMKSLKEQVGEDEVNKFIEKASGKSVPAPIGATASVNIAVWGKCTCAPDGKNWKYDRTIWGGPAYFGASVGFLYTAYEDWDAFFKHVTSVHCQGISSGGGILQINWFNKSGIPVGQFNGAAGGIGLLEAGGSGGWEKK
ncbi:hypothetical protein FMN50_19590 [Rhodobacterales bacterium]|nr:hypothetical protein FMN50_19590 [Rhodobacterales bacterium]